MGEDRTSKSRTPIKKTLDKASINVEQELDKLLELAPHLKSLRTARLNGDPDAEFQSDILEDFRRKLRGE